MVKIKMNGFDDNVDRGDQKGGIQGGAHRTAVYLDERCRNDRPSGPVNTPPERVSRNILVERGVECGPALQTSAAPKIVPVAYPTTGNSSTVNTSNSQNKFVCIHSSDIRCLHPYTYVFEDSFYRV